MYICIYIERERISVYIHIYIYTNPPKLTQGTRSTQGCIQIASGQNKAQRQHKVAYKSPQAKTRHNIFRECTRTFAHIYIFLIYTYMYVYLACMNTRTPKCNAMQCNAIQYITIQYNTIQYNTTQYNTIPYTTIQYNTIMLGRAHI